MNTDYGQLTVLVAVGDTPDNSLIIQQILQSICTPARRNPTITNVADGDTILAATSTSTVRLRLALNKKF